MKPTVRELVAELILLEQYNSFRSSLGHDYGNGQRHAELSRRRRELGLSIRIEGSPTALELAAAFERVGRPRIARATAEDYRRRTLSTRRTLIAWRELEQRLETAN
jgi:hypothetical protein